MTTDNIDYASLKRLPVGYSYFNEVIEQNLYYVDKTPFIKKVFQEDSSKVLLITRPRRFGKSLMMDTFCKFLMINPENPDDTSFQDRIFKDTEIYKDKEFCHKFMGRYPAIFISLKEVDATDFTLARGQIATAICKIANSLDYLLKSDVFTRKEKENFELLEDMNKLALSEYQANLSDSICTLSNMLCRYYGRQIILLIDEYDVPIAKAYEGGYYNDMVKLIKGMLSASLKGNPALFKGVLTGCLRVSKEGIFTGFNNFDTNTITNDSGDLTTCMGFSKDEVRTMLNYYSLTEYEGAVKDWYDGYRIGYSEIFCPWDVVCFCKKAMTQRKNGVPVSGPKSFWSATGTNNVIQEFMPHLNEYEAERMQTLLDGGQIEFQLNEQLSYNEIGDSHSADNFWTMLLYTGYLTFVKPEEPKDQGEVCTVRIPNKELRQAFKDCIVDYYERSKIVKESSDEFIRALLDGNAVNVLALLQDKLTKFVSISDFENRAKPENFYQGFFSGIFSTSSRQFQNFKTNTPAGNGYADITFTSRDFKTCVVIELKSSRDETKLYELAETALKQINTKKYFEEFARNFGEKVFCYGIAFCRRSCKIRCEIKKL